MRQDDGDVRRCGLRPGHPRFPQSSAIRCSHTAGPHAALTLTVIRPVDQTERTWNRHRSAWNPLYEAGC